jgi:CHAT domain-containing protein
LGKPEGANFAQAEEVLASATLESGDLSSAARYLNEAAKPMAVTSDIYLRKIDAINRGQLELALGQPNRSAGVLESAIRLSEGSDVRRSDRATSAEFGGQDRDAYAELAASWLAQGRSPESVLALWERFRLRSRGLPITQCRDEALDCELPRLLAEQRKLGGSVVIGQIVLLDRVLVFRMDSGSVHWKEKLIPRQRLLDAAQRLEQSISSPYTSAETAAKLGAGLAEALLPGLPSTLSGHDALLLEPDPQLGNLSWPVLPTAAGPLGLAYPLAEMRSVLAPELERGATAADFGARALVVGASVATEGEPPLPEAMSEATDVGRLLHAPEVLLGERATVARVGANLGSATIFHFAGHAVQTQSGTELLLAAASPGDKQPWVDGKFLTQHPPRACRLAVLSACATGARQAAWNHPLDSMVEMLASLGVPEVVATRWQIDSDASVPLVDAFYGELAKGDTPAMALTSARRVQFSNSRYRNPYYWGAYYVTGREVERPSGEFHAHR